MVAPYPPGIPIIMPGERITQSVLKYLLCLESFDNHFPGFETETHGIRLVRNEQNGEMRYWIPVVIEK
jgi:arginine decarboxylase